MDKNVLEEEGTRRHKSKGDSLNVGEMIKNYTLCTVYVFYSEIYTISENYCKKY